jgi:hypothetical protein
MRGFGWRARASELYTLLMRILNWAVTLSLFNPYPEWKRPGSVAVSRSSEAVKQGSGVRDEKRAFLEKFGGVYGYPDSSSPIDKLRATEFARLNGTLWINSNLPFICTNSPLRHNLHFPLMARAL